MCPYDQWKLRTPEEDAERRHRFDRRDGDDDDPRDHEPDIDDEEEDHDAD